MTYASPKLSAGLMVPNPTFAIPDGAGSGAANWYVETGGAGFTTTPIIDTPTGRRGIRCARSATGSSTIWASEYTRPYQLCVPATTYFHWAVWWRSTNNTALDKWTLSLRQYDVNGGLLGLGALSGTVVNNTSGAWTLRTGSAAINLATHNPVMLGLEFDFESNGTADWDFCFVGLGTSIGGATPGYFQPTVSCDHPGTEAWPISERLESLSPRGVPMRNDADRVADPYMLSLAHAVLPKADRDGYLGMWNANKGRLWVPSTAGLANPGGGAHPLMIVTGLGDASAPAAMYADFAGSEFPFRVWSAEWLPDDPYFEGTALLRERVER